MADFSADFHDLRVDLRALALRRTRRRRRCAHTLDHPIATLESQAFRPSGLLEADSLGAVVSSMYHRAFGYAGGTCIACFRPALVANVTRGKTYRFTWDGTPEPSITSGGNREYYAGKVPVHLRAMRADDVPAGLRLCRLAHWNQVAADWQCFLASSPGGCRVALDDVGRVIGTVATMPYGAEFSWIGMVLVDPQHRRGGIGTRLLHEALDAAGRRGRPLASTPRPRDGMCTFRWGLKTSTNCIA